MIDFRSGRVDAGDGGALVRAMVAEMEALYDGLDIRSPSMPKAGPEELNPPAGEFLVGYLDRLPVCCGGIKRLSADVCEFKRMFVVPEMRGRGLARMLLGALEARASELGFTIARLDTGPRQLAAQHIYRSAGYQEIPNFNANPIAAFAGEKRL